MIKNIILFTISLFVIIYIFMLYLYFILSFNTNNIYDLRDIKYNDNLRVAVVISGQIRKDYEISLNTIKNNLIIPLKADVFYNLDDNQPQIEKEKIHKFLSPKKYEWKSYDIKKKYPFITNIYRMTLRIYDANQLKIAYENEHDFKYDIVIRIRPDLLIKHKLPSEIINNIKPNSIYVPKVSDIDIFNNIKFFMCDQLDFGDSKTMDTFSNLYFDVDKYLNHVLCERIYYFYMKHNNIDIKYYNINFLIYEEVIKIFDISNNYQFVSKLAKKVYQILSFKYVDLRFNKILK